MVFEGSMTLDEMRQQLQMSKPSMSSGVKKNFDIVKQQFTRGSRKQHFIAEKDFFNFSVISSLENGNERLIRIWRQLKMLKNYQSTFK